MKQKVKNFAIVCLNKLVSKATFGSFQPESSSEPEPEPKLLLWVTMVTSAGVGTEK